MNKVEYNWYAETGTAECIIYCGPLKFKGLSHCHPEDEDMMSKLTGETIAEGRALLTYLRHIKNNELKPQLKALKQLYYSMNRSKHFNPKSYEYRMLRRQICIVENNLSGIKEEITNIKTSLKEYLEQKEKDHKIIKEYRDKKQMVKDNQ